MRRFAGAIIGAAVGAAVAGIADIPVAGFLLLGGALGALVVGSSRPRRTAPRYGVPPVPSLGAPASARREMHVPPMPGRGASPVTDPAGVERFLRDAVASGAIDRGSFDRLLARLHPSAEVVASTTFPAAPVAVTVEAEPAIGTSAPEPAAEPSPAVSWFSRLRDAVVSDVAIHGLAYLGVLLVFAGTLGFVLFSFGELSTAVRPWAEFAIPTVLLGSAAFLRRRGAPVVATALGVVGGLILPVVLFASFVDGVAFPFEFSGDAVGWAVIIGSLALAAAYAAVALRWPVVSVRYLVAPLCWTAAWGIGLLLPDAPAESLRAWTAAGFAFASVAVALTSLAVRVWPTVGLVDAARPSLLPGSVITLGITVLLGAVDADGWPLIVAGFASLVTSEALEDRLGRPLTRLIQPVLLWISAIGAASVWGPEVGGPALVVGSITLLERQVRVRPGIAAIGLNALGVAAGLVTAGSVIGSEPISPVAALVPLIVWSHVRRIRPLPTLGNLDVTPVVSAVAFGSPYILVGVLLDAFDPLPVLVGTSVAAVGTALASRTRRTDRLLAWWVLASVLLLAVVGGSWGPLGAGARAAVLALCTIASVIPRTPLGARAWAGTATGAAAAGFATRGLGLSATEATATVALGAAVLVGAATWWRRELVEHIAAATWVVTGVASVALVAQDPTTWLAATTIAGWTAVTLLATIAFERNGVGAAAVLDRWATAGGEPAIAHVVAVAFTQLGLAATLALALDASGRPSTTVAVGWSALALIEAGATWGFRGRSRSIAVRSVGMGVACLVSAAALVAAEDVGPSAATLVLGVGAIAALAPIARPPFVAWGAWGASGLAVVQVARYVELTRTDVALALAGWAAVLAIGSLVTDEAHAGRREPGAFVRSPELVPPAVLGLVAFVPALLAALPDASDARVAVVCMAGAMVTGVVAILLRVGAVTALTYGFLTAAVGAALPWTPVDHPWIGVIWAALLVVTSVALRARSEGLRLEQRWDLPALGVAAAVVIVALWWSWVGLQVALTWTLAGGLVLATALVFRSPWVTATGQILVVIGAIDAGPGWGALAFAATAAAVAVSASRYVERDRTVGLAHQAASAVLGAGALVEFRSYADLATGVWSGTALALAAASTAVGLWLAVRRRDDPWATQAGFLALAMHALGAAGAVELWPERELMLAVLLVAAGESAAAGVALRRVEPLMLAPVFACAAWLVGIGDLLSGSPMWWAAPSGLMLLVIAGIGRWDRRRHDDQPASDPLSALEYSGMLALLVPPIVETLSRSPARGLIAIGIGVVLAAWGVVTRVRRRLFVGVSGVVAAVTLMLVGPIVHLAPEIQGPMLWIVLAVLGAALIAIATSIERGRAHLAAALGRLDELLQGWE